MTSEEFITKLDALLAEDLAIADRIDAIEQRLVALDEEKKVLRAELERLPGRWAVGKAARFVNETLASRAEKMRAEIAGKSA